MSPITGRLARTAPRAARIGALVAAALPLAACAEDAPSTLDPRGPRAALIADLSWLLFGLGTLVFLIVLAFMLYAIARDRPREGESQRDEIEGRRVIILGGIVLPLIVLPVLWVLTLRDMARLAVPPGPPELTVEVIGHQWWYEVRYPERGVRLVNEMRIPVDRVVHLRVTSADVIHSFWVPQLMDKIDMIPGTVNERWLEASRPGAYLVKCAEFCGLWHARMQMQVLAQPPEQFTAWLESQRGAAAALPIPES